MSGPVSAETPRRGVGAPESDHAHVPERVAEVLRRQIAAGQIPPGTKMPEVRTAQLLEVSRHTVRSAFQMLAAEGLVERHPNRGVFVHSPTPADVRETYRVRRVVELGAVQHAGFGPAVLRALDDVVVAARQASSEGSVSGMAQANQQFHRLIIAQVGSSQLSTFMEQILARMRLVFHSMGDDPTFHTHYVERNARFVELLRVQDRVQAEAYLSDYLDVAEQQLLEQLSS